MNCSYYNESLDSAFGELSSFPNGTRCNFTCHSNHTLVGAESIVCSGKTWNPPEPECKLKGKNKRVVDVESQCVHV